MALETLKYIITIEAQNAEAAARKISATAKAIEGASVSMQKASMASKGLADSLVRIGSRALLTVPIWMSLRLVMLSVSGTFNDSVNSIIKLDEALINAKNEILGLADLENFMVRLKDKAEDLSKTVGISAPKLVETFRQFATAGISAEDSLAGLETAAKGATATMGDSVELGRLLADVYNQMGDKITEVNGAQNKFNFIMSSIASLMPTNTFSIQEFTGALTNFVGTAKTANLTLDETFFLVASSATAMQRGAKGGTQLASAFTQISRQSKAINEFLGAGATKGKSQFEIFFNLITEIQKRTSAGSEVTKDVADIFGLKGTKVTLAEASNLQKVVDEWERFSKLSPNERMTQFIDRLASAQQKIQIQLSNLTNTREELGRLFLEGIAGGESFSKILQTLNEDIKDLKPEIIGLAKLLSELFKGIGTLSNVSGISDLFGGVSEKTLEGIQSSQTTKFKTKNPLKAVGQLFSPRNITRAVGLSIELGNDLDVNDRAQEDLRLIEDKLFIEKLRKKKGLPSLFTGNKSLRPSNTIPSSEKASASDSSFVGREVLRDQIERLKNQGALTSELLKQENVIRRHLKIYEEEEDTFKRNLDLQRAITEEKRLQSRFGSETIELFRIAQTEGVDVAKQIGNVLAGNTSLSTFAENGGKAFDVFKEKFASIFEQQQALQFFKGDTVTGLEDLRGGFGIPIQEQAVRGGKLPNANVQQQLGISKLLDLKGTGTQGQNINSNNTTATFNINNNINLDQLGDLSSKMEDIISESIINPRGKIALALNEREGGIDNKGGIG